MCCHVYMYMYMHMLSNLAVATLAVALLSYSSGGETVTLRRLIIIY